MAEKKKIYTKAEKAAFARGCAVGGAKAKKRKTGRK